MIDATVPRLVSICIPRCSISGMSLSSTDLLFTAIFAGRRGVTRRCSARYPRPRFECGGGAANAVIVASAPSRPRAASKVRTQRARHGRGGANDCRCAPLSRAPQPRPVKRQHDRGRRLSHRPARFRRPAVLERPPLRPHFDKVQLPPVHGFWSLTLYNNRKLCRQPDGSLCRGRS